MGPRFCKRGNLIAARAWPRDGDASMGPRFCKRGNYMSAVYLNPAERASMGPRFCKRGNGPVAEALWLWHAAASMGPRFCKRGNPRVRVPLPAPMDSFNGATLL